jgi:hypothetical protein
MPKDMYGGNKKGYKTGTYSHGSYPGGVKSSSRDSSQTTISGGTNKSHSLSGGLKKIDNQGHKK